MGRAGKIGFALASIAIATSAAVMAQEGRVQRGLVFVRTHCAQCHSIGRFGDSPLAEAPPFRTLHTRYPIENLAEAFAEGITTGHPSMPEFQLDPAQINDLIAYLKSIEP
ncbi:cytochrome c [Microvirga brassicacearum]|uniref:Cytochrome c n=2 Tax=Microvirga brassicacearum TaxID=2580413 RepID=A0A5N3PDW5_9HYPH|nr:cytochrome c [Microvirga brassicacearum]